MVDVFGAGYRHGRFAGCERPWDRCELNFAVAADQAESLGVQAQDISGLHISLMNDDVIGVHKL